MIKIEIDHRFHLPAKVGFEEVTTDSNRTNKDWAESVVVGVGWHDLKDKYPATRTTTDLGHQFPDVKDIKIHFKTSSALENAIDRQEGRFIFFMDKAIKKKVR